MDAADFVFAGRVRLRVVGDKAALTHSRREYGSAEVPLAGEADLEVTFGPIPPAARGPSPPGTRMGRGGHKTVRWVFEGGDPDAAHLRARVETEGWPQGFARSLVQGYLVEPLLSIAAARRGVVLVPGAGIVLDDGLALLLGRSRAGKSTLVARALTAGRDVLGDDQLFVGPDGSAWPFPRSLRFYPDLIRTAPSSYARLRRRTRLELRLRAALGRLSAGYVRPSLAVDGAELGLRWSPEGRAIARLILVERRAARADPARSDLDVAPGSPEQAVEWAGELLREQRTKLATLGGPEWRAAIEHVTDDERALLARAFDGSPVVVVAIPGSWDAATAVAATAHRLGIEIAR